MLYGSFANQKARMDSDIDLAIHVGRALTDDERISYAQEIALVCKKKVDLVDLSQAHGLILREIFAANTCLLGRDSEVFTQTLIRLWFEEADFGPIRKKILIEKRLRIFGV